MKHKSFCNQVLRPPAIKQKLILLGALIVIALLAGAPRAHAGGDAPQWMHTAAGTPLSKYDEKTVAVLLYSEVNVTVLSTDKVRTQVREAYKILRPEGRGRGTVSVHFNLERKIKSLHGWCIPAQGKDFEIKDKDAVEVSNNIFGGDLVSDAKTKVLQIPAPDPGNVVGYEYEVEERPFFLQETWYFQGTDPVRESHFALQLPPGWDYKAAWLNYLEVKPTQESSAAQWSLSEIKAIRMEPFMPPHEGVAGEMIVSFFPPGGGTSKGLADWREMGRWYFNLVGDRVTASPAIKAEVSTLIGSESDPLKKMQLIAGFVQKEIRYVAIELGIGGFQPHPAVDVFSRRYGDCKDKATLVRSMLNEVGVESYHVIINIRRGSITGAMPAHNAFNHVITAIRLPEGLRDPSLIATMQHPKLGKLLFFDPTNSLIPFGQIPVYLQGNYGLLVTPDGGELIQLPQQPSVTNGVQRTAKLILDTSGNLKGNIQESRMGERAAYERRQLETVTKDKDRIKPIEVLLSNSLASYRITHASLINQHQTDKPFGFDYSFEADNYAKSAGNLLLVRPRVIGNEGFGFLETKEPRRFPIEFEGPLRDTDIFEITLPSGYTVDDMPAPVDVDYSFASYHSKTTVKGNVVGYSRTFEVKELSVPVDKAEDLRKLYRIIATDERNTVVLKPTQ